MRNNRFNWRTKLKQDKNICKGIDTESFLKNICGSLFETSVELRDKLFEPKTN